MATAGLTTATVTGLSYTAGSLGTAYYFTVQGMYSDGVNYTSVASGASQQCTSTPANTVTSLSCNCSFDQPTTCAFSWVYTANAQSLTNMTITVCQNSGMTNNCTVAITNNNTYAQLTTLGENSVNW